MEPWKRKLRMCMVGGGEGAFIGAVHRIVATLDQQAAATKALLNAGATLDGDPRIVALTALLRSSSYRKLLGAVPGFAVTHTGDVRTVRA